MAGVAGRVGHDEAGATAIVQGRVELLNPEVVRVVRIRDAEGEAWVAGQVDLVDLVDVERRVRHHEVEFGDRALRVLVVTIGEADVAGQTMQRKVHLRERDSAFLLLHAVDGQLAGSGLVVAIDELGALDEHAARPTGRVEHLAVERFDDLDDQPDDRVRRKELTAESAFTGREVGQEVLVDQPERVTRQLAR